MPLLWLPCWFFMDRGSESRRPWLEETIAQRRSTMPSQPLEVVLQGECAVEIALDVDLAAKVRIGEQHQAARCDEAAQQHRVAQYERECRWPLAHAVGTVVPQAQIGTADEAMQLSRHDALGSVGVRVRCPGRSRLCSGN